MVTLQEWHNLNANDISNIVSQRACTAVIYLNGTRRWFMSKSKNWSDYATLTGQAQRDLSQLFYEHGLSSLIQPLLGYDLLERGQDYLQMAVKMGLGALITEPYTHWFHTQKIRVSFYGRWQETLTQSGFADIVEALENVARETAAYTKRKLLFGLFADSDLSDIVLLAQGLQSGPELIERYYGQPVQPIDLILGAGQPVIWDIPLLDINKAALYFMQAPTFCLNRQALRNILYDYIYQRVNDDQLFDNLTDNAWHNFPVLGLGQQTEMGWTAL